jgi:hypothetical protein
LGFLLRGRRAVGIEGSDVFIRSGRAEWGLSLMHSFLLPMLKTFSGRYLRRFAEKSGCFRQALADISAKICKDLHELKIDTI